MADGETRIIVNPAAFTDEHLPDDILAREAQVAQLRTCLAPVSQGRKPFHAWLHGKPGTGKTAVACYLARQLDSSSRVEVAYVNCWRHSTLFLVLQRIIELLRIVVPDNANSVVKFDRILAKLNGTPLILILDEIDKAQPKEQNSIIYMLSGAGNIGIIAIPNNLQKLVALDDRVISRFNPVQIEFGPYSADELTIILTARAKHALREGSWTPEIMDKIAALAAGDARVAVQTLRNAAQHADIDSARLITQEHVERGWTNAPKLKKDHSLSRLTEHHRLLYDIVEGRGEITTSPLWALYLDRCNETHRRPIASRTFNVYVNTLVTQGLLQRERVPERGNVFMLRPSK